MPNTKGLTINGRPATDDEYKAYWNAVFQRDPEMQRIFAEVSGGGNAQRIAQAQQVAQQTKAQIDQLRASGQPIPQELAQQYNQAIYVATRGGSEQGKEFAFDQRARELGWETPGEGWSLDFDQNGPRVEREGYLQRNKQWIIPAAIGGATGIGLATGGGAAVPSLGSSVGATGSVPASLTAGGATSLGAAPAAAGAAVPALGSTVGPGVGFGAGGAPVSSAGFASGGGAANIPGGMGGGIFGSGAGGVGSGSFYAKAGAALAGDIVKTLFSNKAAGQVNDALQKGGEQALQVYKDALGPGMELGKRSANAQSYLMGLGTLGGGSGTDTPYAPTTPTGPPTATPNGGRLAPPNAPSLGTAIPRPSLGPVQADPQGMGMIPRAQQQTASSYVRMVLNGEEDTVHPSQVDNARRMGAVPVGAG